MLKNIIITLLFSTLLTGCGLLGKGGKSASTDNDSQGGERLHYPDQKKPVGEDQGLPMPTGGEEACLPESPEQPLSGRERPQISFTAVESANTKVAGLNMLPGGLLEIDLDELRGEFCYPLRGYVTSPFGMRRGRLHSGVDIKGNSGDTIRAALPGVVRMSKSYYGYGNMVLISHYCGFETLYSHNTKNLVQVNDVVEAGDPIGLVGRTGSATGDHLHFEVRAACEAVDPSRLIDTDNKCLRSGKLYFRFHDGAVIAYNTEEEFDRLVGDKLRQEADDAQLRAAADSNAAKATEESGKTTGGTKQYHTVKRGDTLSGIAQRYSTSVKRLCELNGITRNSILQINQKIRYR